MEDNYDDSDEIEIEEENLCDYDLCEFCSCPSTKSMGLCTTECAEYLNSLDEADKETEQKKVTT